MQDIEAYLESLASPSVDSQWEDQVVRQIERTKRRRKYVAVGIPIAAIALVSLGACAAFESLMKLGFDPPRPPMKIPVSAPIELDGKSKEEIFELRRSAWKGLPDVPQIVSVPNGTQDDFPSWKSTVSGMPWIGIQGAVYASNSESYTRRFHEGPSVASFFLNNPLLLAGLEPVYDMTLSPDTTPSPDEAIAELVCKEIVLVENQKTIKVLYEIPDSSALHKRIADGKAAFFLNLTNATDTGFWAYGFNMEASYGFDYIGFTEENRFSQVFFCRPLPGGQLANQRKQENGAYRLRLNSLPASIRMSFWKPPPRDPLDSYSVIIRVVNVPSRRP